MTNWLPKKNDKFKAIHKLHNYCYGDGWIFVCLGWTQTYIPKGRRKKAQPRFCEAMPESKLSLPPKLRTADFKLDRSVWSFEAVMEAPGLPQDETNGLKEALYYDRKLRCYGPLMVLVVCLTFWVIVIIAVMAAGKALL